MELEKENGKVKWFIKDKLKVKVINNGEKSEVLVMLSNYNICFKLIMFDFIEQIKNDLMIDILTKKISNGQRTFVVDTENSAELVNYIPFFVDEWGIKISPNTVSGSDIISMEKWYEENLSK